RVLGGSVLAQRYQERAVGVVVGARPLLNHGGREAEGLRTDRPALRVARQHDHLAAREPDLDGPGLDISRGLDAQANRVRRLADGGRERRGRGGIAGAPPRRHQENEQQKRAGHARSAARGGERDQGFRWRAACAGTRNDPLAEGQGAASRARDYLAGAPCAVPGLARESRARAYPEDCPCPTPAVAWTPAPGAPQLGIRKSQLRRTLKRHVLISGDLEAQVARRRDEERRAGR